MYLREHPRRMPRSVLQLLDGFRPERDTSCGIVASIMAGVCWFHTIYLLFVRPFSDPLELGLAILGSVLMSTMASLGLSVAFGISETNAEVEESSYYVAFSYLGLSCMCYFFVQSAILAIAAVVESFKKRSEGDATGGSSIPERFTEGTGLSNVGGAASGECDGTPRMVQIPPSIIRGGACNTIAESAADGRSRREQRAGLLLAAPLLEEDSTSRQGENHGRLERHDDDDDESTDDDAPNDLWRGHSKERNQLRNSQPNPLGKPRSDRPDLQTPFYRRH
jgi:hypothetical protein